MYIKLTVKQIADLAGYVLDQPPDVEITVASALQFHAVHVPDGIYARIKGKKELYGPLGE